MRSDIKMYTLSSREGEHFHRIEDTVQAVSTVCRTFHTFWVSKINRSVLNHSKNNNHRSSRDTVRLVGELVVDVYDAVLAEEKNMKRRLHISASLFFFCRTHFYNFAYSYLHFYARRRSQIKLTRIFFTSVEEN